MQKTLLCLFIILTYVEITSHTHTRRRKEMNALNSSSAAASVAGGRGSAASAPAAAAALNRPKLHHRISRRTLLTRCVFARTLDASVHAWRRTAAIAAAATVAACVCTPWCCCCSCVGSCYWCTFLKHHTPFKLAAARCRHTNTPPPPLCHTDKKQGPKSAAGDGPAAATSAASPTPATPTTSTPSSKDGELLLAVGRLCTSDFVLQSEQPQQQHVCCSQ